MRQGLLVLRSQHPRINTHNSPGCAVLTTPARRFFLASLGHTLTALLSADSVVCQPSFVLSISGNVDAAERISAIVSRALRIHLQDDEPNPITMGQTLTSIAAPNDHADCHFLVDSARADLALSIGYASRLIELPQGVEIDVTNVDSTMRAFLERTMPSYLLEFGGMPWPVRWAARIGRVAVERGAPGPCVSEGFLVLTHTHAARLLGAPRFSVRPSATNLTALLLLLEPDDARRREMARSDWPEPKK